MGKGCFWKRTVLEKDDFRKECIKKCVENVMLRKKIRGTKILWRTKVLEGTKVLWGTKVRGPNVRLRIKVQGTKSLCERILRKHKCIQMQEILFIPNILMASVSGISLSKRAFPHVHVYFFVFTQTSRKILLAYQYVLSHYLAK